MLGDFLQGIGAWFGADESGPNHLTSVSQKTTPEAIAAHKNAELQKEFAKSGLQWRVEDARKAGISPLAALGFQGPMAQPVFTAGEGPQGPDTSTAEALSGFGQNISRAINSTQNHQQRQLNQYQLASYKLDLEGKALDNQIKSSQLRNINTGPAFPGSTNFIPGQGNSGLVRENPLSKTVSSPGRASQEPGWVPDTGFARTATGLAPVPSKDVKEKIEDQMVPEAMWAMRNYLMPNIGYGEKPSKTMLPKGAHDWEWSYLKQEWQPQYKPTKNFRWQSGY